MPTFRYSERIDRTPEEVFDFMMDFSHASSWRSLVKRMETVGGGMPRAGSDIKVTFQISGGEREITTHVTAVDRPHRFSFWNANDGIRGEFDYEVAADAAGSLVSFTCRTGPASASGWPRYLLLMPWIVKSARARYSGQLSALRTAMDRHFVPGQVAPRGEISHTRSSIHT